MKLTGVDASPATDFKQLGARVLGQGRQGNVKATTVTREEQQGSPQYNRDTLQLAIDQLNETMRTYQTELRFELHEKSGEYMVKVLNQADGTVVREIPPERVLNMVAYFKETLGMIVDKMI